MAMDPRLTICIVHYNKVEKLRQTVSNLVKHTHEPYHLKVLNNGYEDEEIRSYLSDLEGREATEVQYNEQNVGCSPGRNQLMRDIDTEFVMTLDDDMYVEDGWFETVVEIFESDQNIGVVGIPYSNGGDDQLRGGSHVTVGPNVVDMEQLDWSAISTDDPYVPVDDVPAGTMVFREELRDEFTWDPQFFIGMDDIDKSLQIMETDWKQVMATGIAFEHYVETDEEYQRVRKDYRERHRSYRKFVSKWGRRYPLRRHLIFNYFFRLPWPVMRVIEATYQRIN